MIRSAACAVALLVASGGAFELLRPKNDLGYEAYRKYRIAQAIDRSITPPIIVLGDSITAFTALPRRFHGVDMINAGIGSAGTWTDFVTPLQALSQRKAWVIVVALGTNDVQSSDVASFTERYRTLLASLAPHAERPIMLVAIPQRDDFDVAPFNAALRTLGPVIDLPKMPTLDGIHLTAEGETMWRDRVLAAVEAKL